jgi:hypothetical protein
VRRSDLPATYYALVATLLALIPVTMAATGQHVAPNAGVAILALLLWGVARRSWLSWSLLLIWNVFYVLAIALVVPGGSISASGLAILACSALAAGLLLSPSMRAHLGGSARRAGSRAAS